MEIESRDLKEYTKVIIHEAAPAQTLVDRLRGAGTGGRTWWATSTSTKCASGCAR
jgi:nitrogen-specific signal transduction histidine kinase